MSKAKRFLETVGQDNKDARLIKAVKQELTRDIAAHGHTDAEARTRANTVLSRVKARLEELVIKQRIICPIRSSWNG